MITVVAVHGIGNLRSGSEPADAAAALAARWQPRLAAGYVAAGHAEITPPTIRAAYYAHLLTDHGSQATHEPTLDQLSPGEIAVVREWLLAIGVPDPAEAQGWVTAPLRQVLDWLARRRGVSIDVLSRVAVALARDANSYLTRPRRRRAARDAVVETIRRYQPAVVVAHSLGSVVTYEALHAHPDIDVELLVTVGSPLGLPVAIFDALEPEPVEQRGARPAGVRKWVNLADPGDLVAVPKRLGDRFPVDSHEQFTIGRLNFHTLGAYLSHARVARIIATTLPAPGRTTHR